MIGIRINAYLLLAVVKDVPELRVLVDHGLVEDLGDFIAVLLKDRHSGFNQFLLVITEWRRVGKSIDFFFIGGRHDYRW